MTTTRRAAHLAAFAALATTLSPCAYETDPYTNRDIDINDSLVALDARVNAALTEVAASWHGSDNEWRFVMAVYGKLGGRHWVDKLERWAMNADEVEKLPVTRRESVISDFPLYAARVARVFGFGPIIKVNGVHVGTDKFGHFFSQGRKFYGRYLALGDEASAARWSLLTEVGLFGRLSTGILSNADLVANYEGYLFYRSLLHDNVIADKPAIFEWREGVPVKRRPFTWADHINALWDEALNPNTYARALVPHVQERLLRLCDDYRRRPERYRVDDIDALFARYRHTGVVENRALRADTYLHGNCPASQTSP